MKKLSILFVLVAFSFGSCKKFLDVHPKYEVDENTAISSLSNMANIVTGAFNQIQRSDLYGGGLVANSELLGDFVNTGPLSDFSLNQLKSRQMNSVNGVSGGLWTAAYHAIHISNVVLANLSRFQSQNPALASKLKGECLFIRAIMHYELVRNFAQPSGFTSDDSHLGIPIRLTPGSASEGQNTPRSTVAQVYAQIIGDLQQAEQLLPTGPADPVDGSIPYVRASKYAAAAFLAKAYFSQNKYTQAIPWANEVINGGFLLNDSVSTIYNVSGNGAASSENIFEIFNTVQNEDNGILYGRFAAPPFGSTIPLYQMYGNLDNYLRNNARPLGDLRYSLYHKYPFGGGIFTCTKYSNKNINNPVVRLAEILLLRAECNAQTGGGDAAVLADVNLIRQRAGLTPATAAGQAALVATVRQERDIELAMEGDRFYEVKRRQQPFVTANGTYNWNDNALIYPIPQTEIDQNKSCVQNPGY